MYSAGARPLTLTVSYISHHWKAGTKKEPQNIACMGYVVGGLMWLGLRSPSSPPQVVYLVIHSFPIHTYIPTLVPTPVPKPHHQHRAISNIAAAAPQSSPATLNTNATSLLICTKPNRRRHDKHTSHTYSETLSTLPSFRPQKCMHLQHNPPPRAQPSQRSGSPSAARSAGTAHIPGVHAARKEGYRYCVHGKSVSIPNNQTTLIV